MGQAKGTRAGNEPLQTKQPAAALISPNGRAAEKPIRRRVPKWALETNGSLARDEAYHLRSIGRALDVLDCFDGQRPLSLKELSTRMKLPESSLFRVLRTLEHHEYLRQDRDGTYQLAPRLIFGWLVSAADRVRDAARAEIENLVNAFNETASLAYLFEDRIHVLDCRESFHEIRMSNKVGRVLPPHCSALGKVITAFQPRPLADRMLEVYGLNARTEYTIVDRQQLFAEFETIRETGVAGDREESIRGGICFAAALRNPGDPVVAAVSLSAPTMRMTAQRESDVKAAIVGAAQTIAQKLRPATQE